MAPPPRPSTHNDERPSGSRLPPQPSQPRPRSMLSSIAHRIAPSYTSSEPEPVASTSRQTWASRPSRPAGRTPSLLSVPASTRSITGLSTVTPSSRDGGASSGSAGRTDAVHASASGSNYPISRGPSANQDGEGALSRLRRIASNASIASTVRAPYVDQHDVARATPASTEAQADSDPKAVDYARPVDVASSNTASDQQQGSASHVAANRHLEPGDANASLPESSGLKAGTEQSPAGLPLSKRPSNDGDDAATGKQARRRTWFGFISSGDHDQGGEGGVTSNKQVSSKDTDASDNRARGHEGSSASPSGDDAQVGVGEAHKPAQQPAQPTSYTDSVRRLVSWGTAQPESQAENAALAAPSGGRGWLDWRAPQARTNERKPIPPERPADDEGTATAAEMSTAPATQDQPKIADTNGAPSDPDHAMQQPSLASRWILYWNRPSAEGEKKQSFPEDASKDENPSGDALNTSSSEAVSSAEQYKKESLAKLEAKDAVLNGVTRSAWVNYFGNRRAAMPATRLQESLDEPEIMRLGDSADTSNSAPNTMKAEMVSKNGQPTNQKDAPTTSKDSELSKESSRKPAQPAHIDPAPPVSRPMTPLTSDKKLAQAQPSDRKDAFKGAIQGKEQKSTAQSRPNLLLPTFEDVFAREPRNVRPRQGMLGKTLSYLFKDSTEANQSKRISTRDDLRLDEAQSRLPRHHEVLGDRELAASGGCKRVQKVTVIGVHGWFSMGPLRTIFGEPTGTSIKFSTMMRDAVKKHFDEAGHTLHDDMLTSIALEADGKVSERVDKSFSRLISNESWTKDLATSDAIFIAAHSQGSIVATHLLAQLIEQRFIDTRRSRVVLLCMCGIHNGPFQHLRGSMTSYYMSKFESPAARELFDYQNRQSPVSQLYAASLRIVVAAGVKLVYVASLDDQVVPLYSALHTSASHPSILRAIFCDGAAFPRVDFLTNLLSFCVNVRNAGLHDHHLVTLLSSSVAGSLYGGAGHSLVYEEPQVFALAVRYLLEVSSPGQYPTTRGAGATASSALSAASPSASTAVPGLMPLVLDAAEGVGDVKEMARRNNNPYTLPWSLRGLLEDAKVRQFFAGDIQKLVRDYEQWAPTTKTLKDVQFRLEPLRMVSGPSSSANTPEAQEQSQQQSTSKTVKNAKL